MLFIFTIGVMGQKMSLFVFMSAVAEHKKDYLSLITAIVKK
jgi:hypothetical protein